MKKILTDIEYWEKYYKNNTSDKEHIIQVCSVYDIYMDILINSTQKPCRNIIEIGGYPGRYLAYIASKYKIKPYSLDFNPDLSKIISSFEAMGVNDYEIYREDIKKFNPQQKFDLVFSNGFIEHFLNYDEMLDKHAEFVNEGGCMMITVPNKRYFRYLYGLLLDYKNLKSHNVKCMKKSVFINFVNRNNLELINFSYFGGFPFAIHQNLNFLQQILYGILRCFFKKINPFLAKHPNKFSCSLLICIARKPLNS